MPSPVSLALDGFILLCTSRLLKVLPFLSCPLSLDKKQPSLGLAFPLRDINQRHPCSPASTPNHLSAREVSHLFDGLRRRWSCGFISPHSHVQGSLFRGFVLPIRDADSSPSPSPLAGSPKPAVDVATYAANPSATLRGLHLSRIRVEGKGG